MSTPNVNSKTVSSETKHLKEFVNHLVNKNLAAAHQQLALAVKEKLKNRIEDLKENQ